LAKVLIFLPHSADSSILLEKVKKELNKTPTWLSQIYC